MTKLIKFMEVHPSNVGRACKLMLFGPPLQRNHQKLCCASSDLVFNDDCKALAPHSAKDLDVNAANIAMSLAIPNAEWIPRHSSPPSKSGLNSAPPVGSWYETDLSPNISHEMSTKDVSDGSAATGWCSSKIYTKGSNDWDLPASSRTTWKRSLRSPRFLGRTVSLSNRSLQSPSAGPYRSLVNTHHSYPLCRNHRSTTSRDRKEQRLKWKKKKNGVPSSSTKQRDLGCLHSIPKLHFTFILFVIKAYQLYQLAVECSDFCCMTCGHRSNHMVRKIFNILQLDINHKS